jgi:hypothetical protein
MKKGIRAIVTFIEASGASIKTIDNSEEITELFNRFGIVGATVFLQVNGKNYCVEEVDISPVSGQESDIEIRVHLKLED